MDNIFDELGVDFAPEVAEDGIKVSKFFKVFVADPDGAEIFNFLTNKYYFAISHTPGDPYATAFCEGQRNVIQELITYILEAERQQEADIAIKSS